MLKTKEDRVILVIYLIISAVSTLVDFSILYLLTSLAGIHYLFSALAGYSMGSVLNYSLNKKYNFRDKQKVRMQFPIYMSIALIGLIFTQILLAFFVEIFDLWYIYAKLLASLIVLIWNFWGHKNVTFRKFRDKRIIKKKMKKMKKIKKLEKKIKKII